MKKDKKTIEMLNKFYNLELRASNLYIHYASLVDSMGLKNISQFLKMLSNDKITAHITRTYDYITSFREIITVDNDSIVKINSSSHLKEGSLRKKVLYILEKVLENELETKRVVNEIANTSLSNKDYETFEFIQWFIKDYIKDTKETEDLIFALEDDSSTVSETKIDY